MRVGEQERQLVAQCASDAMIWKPDAGLLSGASGVALALHAAISPIEPAWDQLLLADLSPSA